MVSVAPTVYGHRIFGTKEICMYVYNEFVNNWKEVIIAQFEELFQYLPPGTAKNHEIT
jgi:hypothetical protein